MSIHRTAEVWRANRDEKNSIVTSLSAVESIVQENDRVCCPVTSRTPELQRTPETR